MSDDVVITGVGCCTPLGVAPDQRPEQVLERTDSREIFRRVTIPADLGGGDELMAVVPGPDPANIPKVRRPFPDRPTLMSFVAVDQALAAAALAPSDDAIGLVLNTCFGPSQTVERYLRTLLALGPAQVSAISFSRAVSNSVVGEVARRHQLRGPSTAILGSSALGYGTDLIKAGKAQAVVCIGVDEVRDLHLWAYRQSGLLDEGLRLGESAAALVLERRGNAEARCAPLLAVIVGYAMGFCNASVHRITDVAQNSIEACMEAALHNAGREPSVVESVVSLANGHAALADTERRAVCRVLGRDPMWLRPKCLFGETFGASEALAAVCVATFLSKSEGNHGTARTCIVNACQVGGGVSSLVIEVPS